MQVLAILLDSVRELRSRSLFWISLAISVLSAVTLFGPVSFNDEGWRILWFDTNPHDVYRAGSPAVRDLMAWIFNEIYVRWWLAWGVIVVGLISTSSVIPEFLAAGSIDLVLAKPISRVKLIAVKFAGSLFFVAAQAAIGVGLAWLLIGVKVGLWPGVAFLAIPLVTLQFFYLYSISTLIAVLTRSTVASLLITLLFWGCFSAVQFSSNKLTELHAGNAAMLEQYERLSAGIRERAEREGRAPTPNEVGRMIMMDQRAKDLKPVVTMLEPWTGHTRTAELLVPKTADVQKILSNAARAPLFTEMTSDPFKHQLRQMGLDEDELEVMWDASNAGKRAARDVDAMTSILTSLIVPFACLAASVVLFVRRDF